MSDPLVIDMKGPSGLARANRVDIVHELPKRLRLYMPLVSWPRLDVAALEQRMVRSRARGGSASIQMPAQ